MVPPRTWRLRQPLALSMPKAKAGPASDKRGQMVSPSSDLPSDSVRWVYSFFTHYSWVGWGYMGGGYIWSINLNYQISVNLHQQPINCPIKFWSCVNIAIRRTTKHELERPQLISPIHFCRIKIKHYQSELTKNSLTLLIKLCSLTSKQ
jgi:hypothetical protein